ncbi:MAG: DUF3500 domain-containing protein [Marmoricola sp.]
MTDLYRGFAARPAGLPIAEGKVDFANGAGVGQMLALIGDAPLPDVPAAAAEPFVGVTTDGRAVPGLFASADDGFDPIPVAEAARHYLRGLPLAQRALATSEIDSPDWRLWINAFLTFPEHGVRLENLSPANRESALQVIRCSLSGEGFDQVRGAMRLNGELGQFVGAYQDTLTEWCYWFTIFGDPSTDQPWGWQLAGHHIDIHCFILGRQMVLTPSFLGTEFKSDELFLVHRESALEFLHSLTPTQRSKAVLYDSITSADLPKALAGAVDGRHRAGAGKDNAVLPYEGLGGRQLSDGQKELLAAVVEPHLSMLTTGPRLARRRHLRDHLDDSWFSWIGAADNESAFYYKMHSPVVLVEYDNHSGIFLDNDKPEPFHVHTIVRTPNGGDYGKALLSQHYAMHHATSATTNG